ncbi:MAG: hypothetical protein LC768_18085 [Acidobacteria bacterium]|nr:hypothetical protein [Acidobacteriota bacterium]MCA1640203.1 hypothetical protein [Acidobacteriota bacterium]
MITILLVSGAVITAVISYLIRNVKLSSLKRRKTNEANQEEHQRVIREAEETTSHLTATYTSSVDCFNKLNDCLKNAGGWLRTAEVKEYKENRFCAFWDAIEHAAIWLGKYDRYTKQIAQSANDYYGILSGRSHTFPSFPVSRQNIPDPSFIHS